MSSLEYKIIVKESAYDLEKSVMEHIAEGWRLHGGVAYSSHHKGGNYPETYTTWAQAMVYKRRKSLLQYLNYGWMLCRKTKHPRTLLFPL